MKTLVLGIAVVLSLAVTAAAQVTESLFVAGQSVWSASRIHEVDENNPQLNSIRIDAKLRADWNGTGIIVARLYSWDTNYPEQIGTEKQITLTPGAASETFAWTLDGSEALRDVCWYSVRFGEKDANGNVVMFSGYYDFDYMSPTKNTGAPGVGHVQSWNAFALTPTNKLYIGMIADLPDIDVSGITTVRVTVEYKPYVDDEEWTSLGNAFSFTDGTISQYVRYIDVNTDGFVYNEGVLPVRYRYWYVWNSMVVEGDWCEISVPMYDSWTW
jgi:hypothetical protein